MECGLMHFDEEIEPFCRWRRTENFDILELHLPPGVQKKDLKIQINSNGILTITGGCSVDKAKSIRFKKETKVAKNCKRNEIRAKVSKGVLHVTMPKICSIEAAPSVNLKGNTSKTQDPKADAGTSNVARCATECHSKIGSLGQRLWRKRVVETVVAMVVVAGAIVGAVKTYQLVMASPV